MRLSNKTIGFAMGVAIAALMTLPIGAGAADQTFGVDNGAHIAMWSRAATQARAEALVQAYNASHKNHIDVTFIPTDDYQTKVGAAAAARSLPDLFSADVVFMPNWTSAGLFQDLTARINALPFAANIAQGAIAASTWDGKKYGLPFVVDLSVWMYNKKLFKQAGLDPSSSRRTPAPSQSWAATSTEPSSAATAAAAGCSPGGRSPGPTATRS
jgi:multiple sugar transport system substrate-binding protein